VLKKSLNIMRLPVSGAVFSITANVLPLAAVGGFGALHCQPSTNVDRSTALDLTTSAPIAASGWWVLAFCLVRLFVSHLVSVFVVRWLGGSFAKLGFGVGLCGFANVPPKCGYFINLICKFNFIKSSPLSL